MHDIFITNGCCRPSIGTYGGRICTENKQATCVASAGLTRLTELKLEGCEELSCLAPLSEMTCLITLNLKCCTNISGLWHLSGKLRAPPMCTLFISGHPFTQTFTDVNFLPLSTIKMPSNTI